MLCEGRLTGLTLMVLPASFQVLWLLYRERIGISQCRKHDIYKNEPERTRMTDQSSKIVIFGA
jgi:hypothetical protein